METDPSEQPTLPMSPDSSAVDDDATRTFLYGGSIDSRGNVELIAGQSCMGGMYRIEDILARGGMGIVYLASHNATRELVVLKMMLPTVANREEYRSRFRREAEAWTALPPHPNIVRAFKIVTENLNYCLVLEYVKGESLQSLLTREKKLTVEKALDVGIQICWGLERAHELALVHRDLKPANVMVGVDGLVKVTDFGLVKRMLEVGEDALLEQVPDAFNAQTLITQGALGTPEYMAPEQWAGNAGVATDIYAFGVLLYQMLWGRLPFTAPGLKGGLRVQALQRAHADARPDFSEGPAALSDSLRAIVERCLAKRPEDRPASFGALAESLRDEYRAATGAPYRAKPSPEELDRASKIERIYGLIYLAYSNKIEGNLDNADRLLAKLKPALEDVSDHISYARYYALQCSVRMEQGRTLEGYELCEIGLHHARKGGDLVVELDIRAIWHSLLYHLGRIRESYETSRDVVPYIHHPDILVRSGASFLLSNIAFLNGHYKESEEMARLAIELNEKRKHMMMVAVVRSLHGLSLYMQARYHEALDAFNAAMELAVSFGQDIEQARILQNTGDTYRELKEFDKSLDCYTRSLKQARTVKAVRIEGQTLLEIARLYVVMGRKEDARKAVVQSIAIKREALDYRLNQAEDLLAKLDAEA